MSKYETVADIIADRDRLRGLLLEASDTVSDSKLRDEIAAALGTTVQPPAVCKHGKGPLCGACEEEMMAGADVQPPAVDTNESHSGGNPGEPKACTRAEERGIAGATGAGQLPVGDGESTRGSADRRSPVGTPCTPTPDESNRHPHNSSQPTAERAYTINQMRGMQDDFEHAHRGLGTHWFEIDRFFDWLSDRSSASEGVEI